VAKSSGLGDAFYVGGYDLSGDTSALSKIGGSLGVLDVTAINKSAFERLGGVRDGGIDWTSYFNPTGAHPVLSALPTADIIATYANGTALGNPAACIVAKQVNYDGTRGQDGSLTFGVQATANAYGLEWGVQLTAGLRTDTAATNGTGVDQAASTSFGWQAYLQVTAFTGTSVTVKIQDSADNSSWADLSGAGFTAATGITSQRLQAASGTATVRRYVRAVTTGTFNPATFSVVFVKNLTTVTF